MHEPLVTQAYVNGIAIAEAHQVLSEQLQMGLAHAKAGCCKHTCI
jgi:hypothetical protein